MSMAKMPSLKAPLRPATLCDPRIDDPQHRRIATGFLFHKPTSRVCQLPSVV